MQVCLLVVQTLWKTIELLVQLWWIIQYSLSVLITQLTLLLWTTGLCSAVQCNTV